jgi:uncharacterized protein DUF4838/glycosyl hydrolase family 67
MHRTLVFGLATVACAILGTAACAADGVTLVENGKAKAVIVLPKDASPSMKWAAEELQAAIEEISGATLPIKNLPGPSADTPRVVIHMAEHVAAKEASDLGTDGYWIRVQGNSVLIAGSPKRGAMYGVYTLIETLGVRWWTPSETFFPKTKTVAVPAMNLREVPKLEYRDMMYRFVFDPAGQLWCARNKLNGMAWSPTPEKLGGRYTFVGNLVHGSHQTLRRGGGKITPEMQALVKGKRTNAQLCLSSPDTLKAMVDGVLASFKKTPDARFVVIGQQDNRNYCRCEKCAAIDKKEDSHCGHNLAFANRVAEEVEKRRPGSAICTAAYEWSRKPPKTIRPRFNVFITLCSIECDFAHPLATAENEVNKAFRKDFTDWGKICPRLYIWDYVTNFRHHLMPFPNLEAIVPNIKFFADNGALGVFEQGAHKSRGSEFVGLRSWVMAKALWNPDLDGRKLIEEFVNGYYGPAAPHILAYIDIIHEPARKSDFVMRIYRELDGPYIAPDVMARAEVALREAEEAAGGNADIERRVRHAHMPAWYVLAKRGPGSPTWKAVDAALGETGKLDMAHIAREFAQVVKDHRINAVADGETIEHWLAWLQDYGRQCADGKIPVPPELEGKDLSKIRLIQGCQFDSRGRWYTKAEGASDGWGVKQPTVAWTAICSLDDPDHFTAGKTYRLFVRARADVKPGGKGRAWQAGVWRSSTRKTPARVRVDADQARDGRWHTYDMGAFKPEESDRFYFAAIPAVCKEVVIDCMWLEEVQEE